MCVYYVGRWELLGVACQVSGVPYQDVVLYRPECFQSQAVFEELVSGSTKVPKTSKESSAPFEQQEVLKYEVT
jgi:hypothetical protein